MNIEPKSLILRTRNRKREPSNRCSDFHVDDALVEGLRNGTVVSSIFFCDDVWSCIACIGSIESPNTPRLYIDQFWKCAFGTEAGIGKEDLGARKK